jgi:hypothetical protein
MNEKMFPVVVQAVAGEGYTVYAYMLDGTIRKVSVEELVKRGGVMEKLKDRDFFVNALTVMNDTVAWDLSGHFDPADCIDIDPFYDEECEVVSDPIEVA